MNPALQPFPTVALPIMVTILAAMWANNSRLTDIRESFTRSLTDLRNDVNRRLDEVVARLDRIERKLDNHEERTSILHR